MTDRIKAEAAGTLAHIGINADCYVLSNGVRVLSQRGILRALRGDTGGNETGNIKQYLARLPADYAALAAGTGIEFELPNGGVAIGRESTWFVDLLKAYKSAWRLGALKSSQVPMAERADAMLDALAGVGIAALIDEATGYEVVRKTGDLARLYDRLLLAQSARWSKMWGEPLVASLCKTYRIQRDGAGVPAPLMGVIGWIYRVVLGKEVHDEVKRRNPRGPDRDKHFQWFQDDLRRLVVDDLLIIKAFSDQSASKDEFKGRLLAHYQHAAFQLGFGMSPTDQPRAT